MAIDAFPVIPPESVSSTAICGVQASGAVVKPASSKTSSVSDSANEFAGEAVHVHVPSLLFFAVTEFHWWAGFGSVIVAMTPAVLCMSGAFDVPTFAVNAIDWTSNDGLPFGTPITIASELVSVAAESPAGVLT